MHRAYLVQAGAGGELLSRVLGEVRRIPRRSRTANYRMAIDNNRQHRRIFLLPIFAILIIQFHTNRVFKKPPRVVVSQ